MNSSMAWAISAFIMGLVGTVIVPGIIVLTVGRPRRKAK